MKREDISEAVGNISTKYIQEAAPNIRVKKKPVWVKWGVVAAVFCFFSMTVFANSLFSSLSGDELSLSATYEGNGVISVQVENRSDKELNFQSKLKLMRWSTSEEVKPLSGKVSFSNTEIPANSSGTMVIDLSDAYDISLLETPISDDDLYYLVLTNNNFLFGQDWMCTVEFAESVPTEKVDVAPITPVDADPELISEIMEEFRPYFESYTLDINERNRLAGEYLEHCQRVLEQMDINIVPSVSPNELTLIDSAESVLFDPAVPADKHHGFFGRLLRASGCALRGGRRILRRFPRLAHLFGIIPLDTLFLQIPGNRIGGGQGRIIMERLLVEEIGICPDRSPFCFRCVPPGLHPALPDTGLHFAFPIGKTALRQFLALVPGLHAHIFLLHFMDFIVGGQKDFLGRTGERVMPQMAVWLLLHVLKAETGFPAACRLVKDALRF